MDIREITDKDIWENFLSQCAQKTFLQSWNWGEFNLLMGNKIWKLGVFENNKLFGVALIVKVLAKRATFLFIPHGPVTTFGLFGKDKKEIIELLLNHVKGIAKEEKASFIRISPIFENNQENNLIFEELGFNLAPIHMHPENSWELDITPPEEDILAKMRKTTRYLIRQAQKNPDIEIIKSTKIDDLKLFWPVYKETAKRHHFVVFSENYLNSEFNCFLNDDQIIIFLGKYKGQVVSAAIFVLWQGTCYYHHSGSLSKFNKISISYLLQWEAIKEAKLLGCKAYNFWGIAPKISNERDAQKSKHPWAGLSLFKMGFGGYQKNYVSAQDYILSKGYWINYIIEKFRKLKRNL
jgi:lipid II:glycine glycyltransferase (peptidoglycan interpeptide bridge formation enzyme)